ncbi:MAG: DUF3096 domain-containing protein [Methanosphaera stadtmanae]|nr:DUF3096 domain-containing protein [Methanosphaera stadtmanae]
MTNQIIYIMAVILGILILVYPNLVSYIVGLFLIIYGVLQIVK